MRMRYKRNKACVPLRSESRYQGSSCPFCQWRTSQNQPTLFVRVTRTSQLHAFTRCHRQGMNPLPGLSVRRDQNASLLTQHKVPAVLTEPLYEDNCRKAAVTEQANARMVRYETAHVAQQLQLCIHSHVASVATVNAPGKGQGAPTPSHSDCQHAKVEANLSAVNHQAYVLVGKDL